MVLHPAIHASILANHAYLSGVKSSQTPGVIAPPSQLGFSAGKRNVYAIDRNRLSMVIYGADNVVVAKADPVPHADAGIHGQVTTWQDMTPDGSALYPQRSVAPGVYAAQPWSKPSDTDGSSTPIVNGMLVNNPSPGLLPVSCPDSTDFDGSAIWAGMANPYYAGEENALNCVSYNGLRRMPFNTSDMKALVQTSGVTPVRFELVQNSMTVFDFFYYEAFLGGAKEPDFVPAGPYKTIRDALVYSGSVGLRHSGSELCFDNLSWNQNDVVAIPELVMNCNHKFEVKRYV